MQVQIGFDTWACLQLMNMLKNCNGALNDNAIVTVALAKDKNNKTSIFLNVNKQYIKQFKKWKEMQFPDDPNKKIEYRDKIIDKWYNELAELYLYVPGKAVVTDTAGASADDDDSIPF